MSGLAEAFAPAEAIYREVVLTNTFGHLAPEPKKEYPVRLVFGLDAYGHSFVLQSDFSGLFDSPWQYRHLMDFVFSKVRYSNGGLYGFVGTYKVGPKGGATWKGKVTRLKYELPMPAKPRQKPATHTPE
jgi:hypothetical protein